MRQPESIVVGSGPNGLVAAIALARAGHRVTVLEASDWPGGGVRSADLTNTGSVHDVCAAAFPMTVCSPATRDLPLAEHGLSWVQPTYAAAHPLDGRRAVIFEQSVEATAQRLGVDAAAYRRLVGPFVDEQLVDSILNLLSVPRHPLKLARFGAVGALPASWLAPRVFKTEEARALFAGMAAHSMLPLNAPPTTAYGLLLMLLGHLAGWPLAAGGASNITAALIAILESEGGSVECNRRVTSLDDVRGAEVVLFDTSAQSLADIAGPALPERTTRRLCNARRGAGIFKVDWVLDGPVPWENDEVALAGTVHLGNTFEEIAEAEHAATHGRHHERPYVLIVQPSPFDPTRSAPGQHTVWAYCHVPNGSTVDMTNAIERQVERYAPGFRDRIVARATKDSVELERYNPNYLGGDINGGIADLLGLARRPSLSFKPWRQSAEAGIYLCSAATPPGGAVHGMCGLLAAKTALADLERRKR